MHSFTSNWQLSFLNQWKEWSKIFFHGQISTKECAKHEDRTCSCLHARRTWRSTKLSRTVIRNGYYDPTCIPCITKTCLYNFDPLKPHFYIVKLGFTGIHTNFLISAEKHSLWVLTIYVLSRNMKHIRIFYLKIFIFLAEKFSVYLNRRVFIMNIILLAATVYFDICCIVSLKSSQIY